jgi:hypothetical protein
MLIPGYRSSRSAWQPVAADWLIPARLTCPAGPAAAARTLFSAAHAARREPGQVIRLGTIAAP